MKILFTGASSLTGMWFVKVLSEAGHNVTACFRSRLNSYAGLRKNRVEQIISSCHPFFDCPFGSEAFFKAIQSEPEWDLFCHHAAEVANYKDPDFDVVSAVHNNTCNLKMILKALSERGCKRILLTGSVFEQNEGRGSEGLGQSLLMGYLKGSPPTCSIFTLIPWDLNWANS